MCGFSLKKVSSDKVDKYIKETGRLLSHRGPDESSHVCVPSDIPGEVWVLSFHRLSVTGVSNGSQPFQRNGVYLMCNGEIYNYRELMQKYDIQCESKSDCEVILGMYEKQIGFERLYGEFAFVILDTVKNVISYGRDTFGVRPLFVSDTEIEFSSELKGLTTKGRQVKPSTFGIFSVSTLPRDSISHVNKRLGFCINPGVSLHDSMYEAVRCRVSDLEVPLGFLLSGGFDSSIVLSMASKILFSGPKAPEKIHVFTTGFSQDAPDIVWAKKVVDYLQTMYGDRFVHHIYVPTIEEGIQVVPDVIRSIESYDTTTVRASVPMWLLSRYIRENTNVKILLSGEGSDELNGSYLYFHNAPSKEEFDNERIRLLENICYFDGLRADRCVSAFGIELRLPFLDKRVIYPLILAGTKIYEEMVESGLEKQFIRRSLQGYLPFEINNRTKAAFSDAVSETWRRKLIENAERLHPEGTVTESTVTESTTSEAMWYRCEFDKFYPGQSDVIPYYWMPKWVPGDIRDPSATVLACYRS